MGSFSALFRRQLFLRRLWKENAFGVEIGNATERRGGTLRDCYRGFGPVLRPALYARGTRARGQRAGAVVTC